MKLSLNWLYAVAAAAVANDEFQFENVICCSILFDASTFTTKCMAIANAFKTSKINVKRNVIQSMCARLPIHVVTLYLALAFFRLPSIRFFHCSECVRFFSLWCFIYLVSHCLPLFLPCSFTAEYVSTIENRSIDRSMHFSWLLAFLLIFISPFLFLSCIRWVCVWVGFSLQSFVHFLCDWCDYTNVLALVLWMPCVSVWVFMCVCAVAILSSYPFTFLF